jgi:hypothetical protein
MRFRQAERRTNGAGRADLGWLTLAVAVQVASIEMFARQQRSLCAMLGLHISVAVAWQRAAAGDWTNYAADIARRANRAEH